MTFQGMGAVGQPELQFDWLPVRRCPACGSEHLRRIPSSDIWCCKFCSLALRNPYPSEAALAAYYDFSPSLARMAAHREMVADNWRERLAIVRRWRTSGRLLDVGSGDGEFLRYARQAGFRVIGTDLSPAAVAVAAERSLDVRLISLGDAYLERRSFDVITLWHVLEHLHDPGAALAEVRELLADDGVAVIAVPNDAPLLRSADRSSPTVASLAQLAQRGDELHLIHFTPTTLQRTITAAGFAVAEFGVDNATVGFSWTTASARFAQKALCAATGWHCAEAMYIVARRANRTSGAASHEKFPAAPTSTRT